jgi:ABC-type nitrate/sulfonate/bicarbonate transport system substrate-binding protein
MRYLRRFLSLAIAFLALMGVAQAADGGTLKMRFTQSGNTSSSWPLYVAEQKKIFEKNGIQVEVIIIRGATNVVRAVLSETIPIGRINPDYVIGAAEKGAKVKIIAANMEKIPYDIYARPEIKTGADLKGKTLGVSTLTGGTTLMVHEVLEKAYKLKENDYKLLVVGTSPERYAALKGGSVQASFMGPPLPFARPRTVFASSRTSTNIWVRFYSPPISPMPTTSNRTVPRSCAI